MSIIIEYQLVEPIIRLKNVPNFKRILNTLPEGAEALIQGQLPGFVGISLAPCKGKSLKKHLIKMKILCDMLEGGAVGI